MKRSALRIFGASALLTVATLAAVTYYMGPAALLVAGILVGVELAFSFDNAIINAKILGKLSPFWQKMFLTVGVVIAIFGMRIIFPMLIVMATAHLSFGEVINLAFHHPGQYAKRLDQARPSIEAFGGSFLMVLALHFFMDDNKTIHWIRSVEKPLKKLARWWIPSLVTLIVLILFALMPANHHTGETLQAGIGGIILYLVIHIVTEWMGTFAGNTGGGQQAGIVAFLTFLYLQMLDASFSFDGVVGAFAISNSVVLIAAGLGVGALWVRSLTVYMVRHRMLESYVFLEHGAHYAIFALAIAMFLGLLVEVPEFITGLAGLGLIGASVAASIQALHRRSGVQ